MYYRVSLLDDENDRQIWRLEKGACPWETEVGSYGRRRWQDWLEHTPHLSCPGQEG